MLHSLMGFHAIRDGHPSRRLTGSYSVLRLREVPQALILFQLRHSCRVHLNP